MRDGVASVNKADSVGKVQTVDVVETLLKYNTVDKITECWSTHRSSIVRVEKQFKVGPWLKKNFFKQTTTKKCDDNK